MYVIRDIKEARNGEKINSKVAINENKDKTKQKKDLRITRSRDFFL